MTTLILVYFLFCQNWIVCIKVVKGEVLHPNSHHFVLREDVQGAVQTPVPHHYPLHRPLYAPGLDVRFIGGKAKWMKLTLTSLSAVWTRILFPPNSCHTVPKTTYHVSESHCQSWQIQQRLLEEELPTTLPLSVVLMGLHSSHCSANVPCNTWLQPVHCVHQKSGCYST